eukprot:GEMP01126526.1.p1 GENE.GEMP01126526.1~~GEMP01126526.1.p1  ORF type:complete len:124 (-),score=12.53 GEMP01126526.1:139-510(-)
MAQYTAVGNALERALNSMVEDELVNADAANQCFGTLQNLWTHPTSNYQLDLRVNRADLQNYRITLEEIDLFATNATVTVESLGNNVFKQWHSRSIHVSGPRGGMKGTPHERECEPKHEPRKKK